MLHIGNYAFGGIDRAAQVRRKNGVPHIKRKLIHSSVFKTDVGGVIDQNIHLAVFVGGVFDKRFYAFGLHYVHKVIACFSAFRSNGIHNRLSFCFAAAADNNRRAFGGVKLRNTHAYAAG